MAARRWGRREAGGGSPRPNRGVPPAASGRPKPALPVRKESRGADTRWGEVWGIVAVSLPRLLSSPLDFGSVLRSRPATSGQQCRCRWHRSGARWPHRGGRSQGSVRHRPPRWVTLPAGGGLGHAASPGLFSRCLRPPAVSGVVSLGRRKARGTAGKV